MKLSQTQWFIVLWLGGFLSLLMRRTCKIIVPADTAVAPLKKEAFF